MVNFMGFTNCSERKIDFLQDLEKSNNFHLQKLANIIKNEKTIKLKFNQSNVDRSIYLIMVKCHIDFILIRLARKYGFPRGFPILWIPGKKIQTFGFYPKFDNDTRQSSDDYKEFNNVIKVEFFKKWSGFLGQIIPIYHNNTMYWTFCSKNCVDGNMEVIKDGYRIFSDYISKTLLNKILNEQLHICAEMMSFNDQTHGSKVENEFPVVTAIGYGIIADLESKSSSNCEKMVNFLNHKDMVCKAIELGLPVSDAIIVHKDCQQFLKDLSCCRDIIMDDKFEQFLSKYYDSISIISGNIKHKEILGNILEGLVLFLHDSSGKVNVKKYKFPAYTIRTMLLRPIIKNNHKYLIPSTEEKIKYYISSWTVSEEGKIYWSDFARICFVLLSKNPVNHENVGLHIQIADQVLDLFQDENPILSKLLDEYHQNKDIYDATICLFIGPIASGKTTATKQFASFLGDDAEIIDGDILDLDENNVKKLKGERNDYTIWTIVNAILNGKIPLVSQGGGVFFQGKKLKFIMKQRVQEILGIEVKIHVFFPDNVSTVKEFTGNLNEIYRNNDLVKQGIFERMNRYEVSEGKEGWVLPSNFINKKNSLMKSKDNFAEQIANISLKNLKFALEIEKKADQVYSFPRITPDNIGLEMNFDTVVNPEIPKNIPKEIKLCQLRLLVKCYDEEFRHITVEYNMDRKNFSKEYMDELLYQAKIAPKEFLLTTLSPKIRFIMVYGLDEIITSKIPHITISSEPHKPMMVNLFAQAIRNKDDNIEVDGINYDLTNIKQEPCECKILKCFGI